MISSEPIIGKNNSRHVCGVKNNPNAGERAFVYYEETPHSCKSSLNLEPVLGGDSGQYRCRVDYDTSPTRNTRIKLKLVGKLNYILMTSCVLMTSCMLMTSCIVMTSCILMTFCMLMTFFMLMISCILITCSVVDHISCFQRTLNSEFYHISNFQLAPANL